MSEVNGQDLPPGWARAELSAIAKINPPLDRCILNDDVAVDFVPMRAVEPNGGGLLRPETSTYGAVKKGFTAFIPGDVIMAKITPCMENGKTCVVPELPGAACFGSTEFHVVRAEEDIDARWISNFLLQHSTRHTAQRQMMGGVGQMRVPTAFLESLRVPVPPAPEQQRILESTDELLSDLDAGVAALERVQAKLKHYRAALLQAAVEGALTAEWRAQHPVTEPASALLTRILAERRRRWEEAQLQKFRETGKAPPKDWKAKYIEPVAPEKTEMPPLPEGWAVASMDAVTCRITSGSRDWQQYYGRGSGTFVMAQNVRPGRLDMSYRQSVSPPASDSSCERSLVECDDLLVTIVGANTGDVCRVPEPLVEHYVCQSVALMRPVQHETGRFLDTYFNSPGGGQLHFRRYLYGAGRPHLSFDQLKMTPVLLPPLAEQEAIVEVVEDQLSLIEHLEADLDAKLTSAHALRQSILRHAFTGQLVPQHSKDEPATELLKRIAAQREELARQAQAAKKTEPKASPKRAAKKIKAKHSHD
ncbi:MAG: restriction endonuclease subunit S [Gammaproteobacteria bacterium]|nr:restriction endonuclease subunit S [Gammaproteobacteria bacterium]